MKRPPLRTPRDDLTDEMVGTASSPILNDDAYVMGDRAEPGLRVMICPQGKRVLYAAIKLGEWPELTVQEGRDIVRALRAALAAYRVVGKPLAGRLQTERWREGVPPWIPWPRR